ncbi:MAG: CRISPR-associated helicase Cas3' [Clostridiales bacterium]|jgi:CRISPR-associated endonuclease/helicase Cas3|nr:CRISPR-associated helicase Cas3' [Clostridiales bacterium]
MNTKEYIAHTRGNNNEETQPLIDHLTGTAEIARKNAFGWGGDFAYCCGLAHDIGKYSNAFQRRIGGANIRVDHSTAGGKEICKTGSGLELLAAYCITGHHGGLLNGGCEQQALAQSLGDKSESTLMGRLKSSVEDYNSYKNELVLPSLTLPDVSRKWRDGFDAAFFVRMIFSSLVDADRLDTEDFCNYGNEPRGGFSNVGELFKRLNVQLERFLNINESLSPVNQKRNELLKDCLSQAFKDSGLFKLTAPTGSGKTIASLAFALKHAVKNNLRRVIYIIPYNSIIDQNAAVFEQLLGRENVLRHNSDVIYDGDDEESKAKRFSAENWDYPIIVTSSVQFFESLFSNNPSKCRKLHNISESVLIFDEAQMIPVPYLLPCVHAIETLVSQYNCSAVLATATQSAIDKYFKQITPREISSDTDGMFNALKRAHIKSLDDDITDERLMELLLEADSVLCIVNTRLHAQSLFKRLKAVNPEGLFHLSTTMYPAHRKRILEEIRKRLSNNEPLRVISTSLVEAGVDLDFATVYREEAGLDSIVQAAGRCNREGTRNIDDSAVYVFSSAEQKPPRLILPNICAYRQIARKYSDLSGLDTIEAYFTQLFCNLGEEGLDIKRIIKAFNDGVKAMSFPFEDVAKAFKLIDDKLQMIVYYLNGQPELEKRLRNGERTRELFRNIGAYGINLYEYDVNKLRQAGAIEILDDNILILSDLYYEDDMGVTLTPVGGQAIFV